MEQRDSEPMLGIPEVRRLILGLIAEFQDGMLREGRLARAASIGAVAAGLGTDEVNGLAGDEATLGLDSLATIELVTRLNLFFGLDATGVEDYLLVRRSIGEWVELVAHHFSMVGEAPVITFETSGSTGTPKRIRQTREALSSEVDGIVSGALRETAVRRVLCAVPVTHIYGFLWGVMLPKRLGIDTVDLPPGLPGAMLRMAKPGDLVLATPFSWDRTADCATRLPRDVTGVTSGGPTTATTWAAGRACGLARMIEVYGSSETGGVGWRDREGQPFALMPDIEASAAGQHTLERAGAGILDVQDHLEWVGASEFRVCGRRDPVVQVAGINVNLFELRALIEAEPGVKEAAVRLDGDRLKAFVVPSGGATPDIEDRLRRSLSRLPAPARPERFGFGPEIPRSATGKLTDW
jgi:4-coumarate--CoA ligase